MPLNVVFRGGTRFEIASGRHTVVSDQPIEDGGDDAGMSPVELFVASLAGCIAYFVARYCARHHIPTEGFTLAAGWTMAEQPHRVGAVDLRLHLPVELTPAQRERLLKVAHGCTVHQSLAVPPNVTVEVAAQKASSLSSGA